MGAGIKNNTRKLFNSGVKDFKALYNFSGLQQRARDIRH